MVWALTVQGNNYGSSAAGFRGDSQLSVAERDLVHEVGKVVDQVENDADHVPEEVASYPDFSSAIGRQGVEVSVSSFQASETHLKSQPLFWMAENPF